MSKEIIEDEKENLQSSKFGLPVSNTAARHQNRR
jgi:hypothetical protein